MNTDFTNVTKVIHNGHDIKKVYKGNTLEWKKPPIMEGLRIVNESNETNTFTLTKPTSSPNSITLNYALESASSISQWSSSSGNLSVSIPVGDVLILRAKNTSGKLNKYSNYYKINCSKNYSVEGKLAYLLSSDATTYTLESYAFANLFYYSTTLIHTKNLIIPSKKTTYMYNNTFAGCSNLLTTPYELPGGLSEYIYKSMFENCSSITESPIIRGGSMSGINDCLNNMFKNCTKLKKITTTITYWVTNFSSSWVSGVASSGNFYDLGNANPSTGTSGRPSGWTRHTSL